MILLTGATGYLGGYVLKALLDAGERRVAVLVRGADRQTHVAKLWRGLQLHFDADAFRDVLPRLDIVSGDLHAPGLGLSPADRDRVLEQVDSVVHAAASLNRKSAKACFNTNLRGGLSVIELARDVADRQGGLRRYSFVSTVAVAGHRWREDVAEDDAISWDRSDYDPYARTKKFGEHMVQSLLSDVPNTVFRPAILLGDGHRPETTQFDMARAFVGLANMPVVPLRPRDRIDIVNVAWAANVIAKVHLAKRPDHAIYHLSAGAASPTAASIRDALASAGLRPYRLMPSLDKGFSWTFRAMNRAPRGSTLSGVGALMKVFWPYIRYDTVFNNARAVSAVDEAPVPFERYAAELYRWCRDEHLKYPYLPLPDGVL